MAGSYNHAVADDGQLLCNDDFTGMVENLGDAYETVEEMYGMIWWLAAGYSMHLTDMPAEKLIEHARRGYKDGLMESPGTDGRLSRDEDDE
jgi:hypothetical protein